MSKDNIILGITAIISVMLIIGVITPVVIYYTKRDQTNII